MRLQQSSLMQNCAPGALSKFFRQHSSSPRPRFSWQDYCLQYSPTIRLMLAGQPADLQGRRHMKCAIMWWNRQLSACARGDLSDAKILSLGEISPGFELEIAKLRLNTDGTRKRLLPKNRHDYHWFASRLVDCLERPETGENKKWLEVLKYRYRHNKLDHLQESMVETAYPGFCTEKAIMEEKCRKFEENLLARLADPIKPANKHWLYSCPSLARRGKIHPKYAEILDRHGLLARKKPVEPGSAPRRKRHDHLAFARRLSDCLENPDTQKNRRWIESARSRYRGKQLDPLQESMLDAAYPGFCTQKAIVREKCRRFEERLKRCLADPESKKNKHWLNNNRSLARLGEMRPQYIKIMKEYGQIACRRGKKQQPSLPESGSRHALPDAGAP